MEGSDTLEDSMTFYIVTEDYSSLLTKNEAQELTNRFGKTQTKFMLENLQKPQRVEQLPERLTVSQLLDLAGGFGKLQWFSYLTILVWNLSISLYFYNLPYLELMPKLLCKQKNQFGVCSAEYVCKQNPNVFWKIDYSSSATIHNWMTDSKNFCIGSFKLGLIGSWFFCGVLWAAIAVQLSNWVGRKRYIQIWSLISIFIVYLLYFQTNLNVRIAWWFLLGSLISMYFCSYSYLLDITPQKHKGFMNYLFLLTEFFIPNIASSCYFYFGGKDWRHLFTATLVLAPLGFLMLSLLPRSPQYLFDNHRTEEAEIELRRISTINQGWLPNKFEIIKEDSNANFSTFGRKVSYLKEFKNLAQLLVVITVLSFANFNSALWDYYIKYIKTNMFEINIFDCVVSVIVILLSYSLLSCMDVKKVAFCLIAVALPWTIPVVCVMPSKYHFLIGAGVVGISAAMNALGVLTFYFISKTFPPAIAPLVITISNFWATLVQILAPEVAEVKGTLPISIFTTTSLITLMVVLFMKSSKQKDI